MIVPDENMMAGCWECGECGFMLTKSILSTVDGNIYANTEPFVERCPNDNVIMTPMTYRMGYVKLNKAIETQVSRAVAAEERERALIDTCAHLRQLLVRCVAAVNAAGDISLGDEVTVAVARTVACNSIMLENEKLRHALECCVDGYTPADVEYLRTQPLGHAAGELSVRDVIRSFEALGATYKGGRNMISAK